MLTAALGMEGRAGPESPVISLAVRNHLDEFPGEADLEPNILMPEREILAGEFGREAAFREFPFRFTLKRPTLLSFNVRHFARPVYLDTVAIMKVSE